MAINLQQIAKYKDLLINLLPIGRLWQPRKQPVFDAKLESIAVEMCRVEDRMNDLLREADPRITDELLEDWLRITGLPDECTPDDILTDELRQQMVEKYTNVGGLSKDFYEAVGLQLGFVITAEKRLNFEVGRNTVGEALWNYYNDPLEVGETVGEPLRVTGWRYVWNVEMPIAAAETLEVGETVGNPLVEFDNELVRCVIEKLKPAHSSVTFTFVP